MNNFFDLYDAILSGVDSPDTVSATAVGEIWSLVSTECSTGIAMTTHLNSVAPMYTGFRGMSLRDAAQALKSWNFTEASLGMAAVNAFYNTEERLEALGAYEPFENYCTEGIDFNGKTVALIGHMHGPQGMREKAKQVYILERSPQDGDYPDSACDFILPQCDIVLITGSTLINKTLPHLLELCRNSYTILTGPSVPMCPALLDMGLDRIAGMIVTKRDEMYSHCINCIHGSPYSMGTTFLLTRDNR